MKRAIADPPMLRPQAEAAALALEEALARHDEAAFDRAAEALGGGRALLAVLLSRVTEPERARIERWLPARPPGPGLFTPRLNVAALAAAGPAGLWLATEWILRVVPGNERSAPVPAHEGWDALVEIHRSRPETAWLPIELLASLHREQRSLGRRILIGLDRRFGVRAQSIAAARLRIGSVPLAELLARAAEG